MLCKILLVATVCSTLVSGRYVTEDTKPEPEPEPKPEIQLQNMHKRDVDTQKTVFENWVAEIDGYYIPKSKQDGALKALSKRSPPDSKETPKAPCCG